jgi:hypothetical protein
VPYPRDRQLSFSHKNRSGTLIRQFTYPRHPTSVLYIRPKYNTNMKAILAVLAFLFIINSAQGVLVFCQDSEYDATQPAFNNILGFYAERSTYQGFRDFFASITQNVDLGNTTVEADIIAQLQGKLTDKGYDLATYSFTITRSNGDITMDTGLGVNPVIDNHGGRYSIGKPMLCRDFGTLVFDYTYVTRTGKQYHFWSQAVQTSVQKQWFTFRWNVMVN